MDHDSTSLYIIATVLTDRGKTNTVAFNRIQDRDDVLRECDGLEINGKKDRFINFLENFHLSRDNLLYNHYVTKL